MKYYKFLSLKGESCHGGNAKWHLPKKNKDGTWKPGKWMPKIKGGLKLCDNGYHFSKAAHLLAWLGSTMWEIEVVGDTSYKGNKGTASEVRLVKQIETWDAQTARLFACDCAEHVLHIFEEMYPEDKRPRAAIEAARRFAVGEATRDELNAARADAWAAFRDAWTAAIDAARAARDAWTAADAARTADGAAEDVWGVHGSATGAARAAAWGVVRASWGAGAAAGAARTADDAAEDAVRAAAEAAVRAVTGPVDAVWAACGDTTKVTYECRWQVKRLRKILGI